jgi:ATP-dependent RNA helicase RhlE
MVPSDYVHRIGRTGRAGITGTAVSLVCVDEAPLLRDIERLLHGPIASQVIPGFEPNREIRPEPIRLRSGQHAGQRGGQRRAAPGPRRDGTSNVRFGSRRGRRPRRAEGSFSR